MNDFSRRSESVRSEMIAVAVEMIEAASKILETEEHLSELVALKNRSALRLIDSGKPARGACETLVTCPSVRPSPLGA